MISRFPTAHLVLAEQDINEQREERREDAFAQALFEMPLREFLDEWMGDLCLYVDAQRPENWKTLVEDELRKVLEGRS